MVFFIHKVIFLISHITLFADYILIICVIRDIRVQKRLV